MKRLSTDVLRKGLAPESQRPISGQILQRDVGAHHPLLKSSLIYLRGTEEADEDFENEEEWEEGVSEEKKLPAETAATRASQSLEKVESDERINHQQEAEAHSNALEKEVAEEEEKVQEEDKKENSSSGLADEESRGQSRTLKIAEGEKVEESKGHALTPKLIKIESPHYMPDWAKRKGNEKNKPISEKAKQTESKLLNQGSLRASSIVKQHNRVHRKQSTNEETRGLHENDENEIKDTQIHTKTKEQEIDDEEPGDKGNEKMDGTKYTAQQAQPKAEKIEGEGDGRAKERIEKEEFESKHRAAGTNFTNLLSPLSNGKFTVPPTTSVNFIPISGQQVPTQTRQPLTNSLPLAPLIGKTGTSITSPGTLFPVGAARGFVPVPPVFTGSQSTSVEAVSPPLSTDLIVNPATPTYEKPAADLNAVPVLSSMFSSPDKVLASPLHQVVLPFVPQEVERRLLAATAAAAQQAKLLEEGRRDWSTGGAVVAVLLALGLGFLVYIFYEKISRSITRMRRRYAEALERRRKAREETSEAKQDEKNFLSHHNGGKPEN